MDAEGKVESRTAGRHGTYLALRREDENLGGKKVQLDGVEEVHSVGLGVVKDFLDGAQPVVEFVLVLGNLPVLAVLVFPVSGKALLGNLVHAVGAYLHLYPASLLRHQRDVQGLVAVGLGMAEPVAQPVGMAFVYLGDGDIDIEALVDFLLALVRREDDADSQDVVNLVEGDMLVLHLRPDGVRRLHAFLNIILDAHLLQGFLNGCGELVEQLVTRPLGLLQLVLDAVVLVRMLVTETEVLQFRLHLVESQTVG